ncbi:unnamed protein product [marine sediment metagenome]|uniref:Mor transcription activator domain-containing protein n=1 Tax=marine sediment metagenome TaxID=412755 RepID=X1J7Z6_9ZZZZ
MYNGGVEPRYSQMKQNRNDSLKLFKARKPDMTLQALGNIYHISRQRVSAILKS